MCASPNFPGGLDIVPSSGKDVDGLNDLDPHFGATAQKHAIETYGIAGRVWWIASSILCSDVSLILHREASYAMLAYLNYPSGEDLQEFDPPPFTLFNPHSESLTVIELGSGTGLVASQISALLKPGRDLLYATDLPEVCPLLENNLRDCSTVIVRPLAWGNRDDALAIASDFQRRPPMPDSSCVGRRITHIICSDLVGICYYFTSNEYIICRRSISQHSLHRSFGHSCISPHRRCCLPMNNLPCSSYHTRFAVSRKRRPSGPPLGCGLSFRQCYTGRNVKPGNMIRIVEMLGLACKQPWTTRRRLFSLLVVGRSLTHGQSLRKIRTFSEVLVLEEPPQAK